MARPKLGDSETVRLDFKITADEIAAIDEWRFAHRVPSRSEAIRRLISLGLPKMKEQTMFARLNEAQKRRDEDRKACPVPVADRLLAAREGGTP